jgi:hypothetical protein
MNKTTIKFDLGKMDLEPLQIARRVYHRLKQFVSIGNGGRKLTSPAMFQSP